MRVLIAVCNGKLELHRFHEENTEATPLLLSEVSSEVSLLKLPSNICEDTELQPASWAEML